MHVLEKTHDKHDVLQTATQHDVVRGLQQIFHLLVQVDTHLEKQGIKSELSRVCADEIEYVFQEEHMSPLASLALLRCQSSILEINSRIYATLGTIVDIDGPLTCVVEKIKHAIHNLTTLFIETPCKHYSMNKIFTEAMDSFCDFLAVMQAQYKLEIGMSIINTLPKNTQIMLHAERTRLLLQTLFQFSFERLVSEDVERPHLRIQIQGDRVDGVDVVHVNIEDNGSPLSSACAQLLESGGHLREVQFPHLDTRCADLMSIACAVQDGGGRVSVKQNVNFGMRVSIELPVAKKSM